MGFKVYNCRLRARRFGVVYVGTFIIDLLSIGRVFVGNSRRCVYCVGLELLFVLLVFGLWVLLLVVVCGF